MQTSPRKITALELVRTVSSEGPTKYISAVLGDCGVHGEFTSWLVGGAWTGCVTCDLAAERRALSGENAAWRKELKAREWREKLGRAAIPDRFADRRLSSYVPDCDKAVRALAVATAYAGNFDEVRAKGMCLLFCGEVGTGKTHLAVGIAHEVLEQGKQAVFTSVIRAVRSVKETYAKGSGRTEAQALRDLVEPDLLILDEVGVQFGSDTEKMILFEIINGRYEASRPTIVISNLAAAALEEYLGERSFDRLREGGGRLVVFDWASHRARRAS